MSCGQHGTKAGKKRDAAEMWLEHAVSVIVAIFTTFGGDVAIFCFFGFEH
jgi:hypothetical protein